MVHDSDAWIGGDEPSTLYAGKQLQTEQGIPRYPLNEAVASLVAFIRAELN
jgi:hypothetical protein